MFDVVTLIQSYLGNVARELDNLLSKSSIARLLNLELTFGNAGSSNAYSPWHEIDHFGRDRIKDAIHTRSPERRKVTADISSD